MTHKNWIKKYLHCISSNITGFDLGTAFRNKVKWMSFYSFLCAIKIVLLFGQMNPNHFESAWVEELCHKMFGHPYALWWMNLCASQFLISELLFWQFRSMNHIAPSKQSHGTDGEKVNQIRNKQKRCGETTTTNTTSKMNKIEQAYTLCMYCTV